MHAAQPPTSPPTQAFITGTSNASIPFADEQVVLTRQEYIQLQSDLNRVTSLHQRALKRERWYKERYRILLNLENLARRKREADLIAQLKTSAAKVRDLQQRLFGKQSEKGKGSSEAQISVTAPHPKRNKGHQPGAPNHGRTMHPELPEVHEHCTQDHSVCPACHKPRQELCTTEDSSVIEIEVKAYVRRIHRHYYIKTCDCPSQNLITCAPVPPKLIAKGKYGVSVWSMILLDKYLGGTPTERLLQKLNHIGLHIAPGTIVDGLKKIAPLFEPIDAALLKQLRLQTHWHADETRWAMFVEIVGKIGHRWYLWVFHSAQVVHYVLDPSRASQVVIDEFEGVVCGIISCDRYSGYKGFVNETVGIELAFCWVHQRRDFLNLANSYPEHLDWAFGWVQSIGHLYHLNDLRLQVSADSPDSPERTQAQNTLEQAVQSMANKRDLQLQSPKLAEPCQKVLQSMTRHWAGLTVFVRHSEVPMDNNTAERDMRGPVVGRKNFFGSGALWSGQLAATLYSLFATLKLYGINARTWMLAYLQACAGNGGQAPKDLSSFLPWSMNEARLQVMRASVPMAPMEPITPNSAAPPSPHPSRARSGGPAPPESQVTPGQTANQTATQAATQSAEVDSP